MILTSMVFACIRHLASGYTINICILIYIDDFTKRIFVQQVFIGTYHLLGIILGPGDIAMDRIDVPI